MKINFGGQEVILHHSGMAFLPEQGIGIVSDLHLEKGSHFAKRGFFLPPYDSLVTLKRLLDMCDTQAVERLILLGDCFHDPDGFARMDAGAKGLFNRMLEFQPVWIKGNHDKGFVPKGLTPYEFFEVEGLIFRHEAIPGEIHEISGHFHPKASVLHKETKIQRPCFVEDGKKLILPAFGAYTGGLFVSDPVIKNLFNEHYCFHVLGKDRVFSFSS